MADEDNSAFELRADRAVPAAHVYGEGIVCATEGPGRPKDRNVTINEIVVGLGDSIPLWAAGVTLYWRFNTSSFNAFANPDAAKTRIRALMGKAIASWGTAAPVKFVERKTGWDFEVVLRNSDNCSALGCVLASAYFPDGGRHKLTIYPKMLQQPESEQIETMVHELGHVFGLRHFFAKVSETQIPSEIFGTHVAFSIMNYGAPSVLTEADRTDLTALYQKARSGELRAINGTPITLVRPFSSLGA